MILEKAVGTTESTTVPSMKWVSLTPAPLPGGEGLSSRAPSMGALLRVQVPP